MDVGERAVRSYGMHARRSGEMASGDARCNKFLPSYDCLEEMLTSAHDGHTRLLVTGDTATSREGLKGCEERKWSTFCQE